MVDRERRGSCLASRRKKPVKSAKDYFPGYYFQYFTGELYFQHRVRMSARASATGAIGWGRMFCALLSESLAVAEISGALTKHDMEVVTVDTTVQEFEGAVR